MKIYFSASITEDEKVKGYYKQIISALEGMGHTVLQYGSDHLKPSELLNRSDEQIESAYKMLDKLMKQADLIVTEVSYPSIGVGYEISEAVSQKKPVLALSHKEAGFQPLATLQGNKSKYIEYHQYDNDIEGILKTFIDKARDIIDTKFILIISPEIDKYLEWVSQERRMHKAQIVREAIENQMLKDKEYQQFLKDL
jgi:2'-deoxynucleoside 5'-phosphate N-hydrolase